MVKYTPYNESHGIYSDDPSNSVILFGGQYGYTVVQGLKIPLYSYSMEWTTMLAKYGIQLIHLLYN